MKNKTKVVKNFYINIYKTCSSNIFDMLERADGDLYYNSKHDRTNDYKFTIQFNDKEAKIINLKSKNPVPKKKTVAQKPTKKIEFKTIVVRANKNPAQTLINAVNKAQKIAEKKVVKKAKTPAKIVKKSKPKSKK